MLDLNMVLDTCKKDLDKLGIPYSKNIQSIKYENVKSRFGVCQFERSIGQFTIKITKYIGDCTDRSKRTVYDTVMHELIHTCPGSLNHGKEWKKYANMVNRIGYKVKETSNCYDFGLTQDDFNYKYILECDKCRSKWYRSKKSKLVDNAERFKCACGGQIHLIKGGNC